MVKKCMGWKCGQWSMVILLLGFQNLHILKIPFFCLILLIYIMTFCANLLIIVLVSASRNLQYPMYFLLQSICGLLQPTTIVLVLLQTVINGRATLSVGWCITQFYCYCCLRSSEVFASYSDILWQICGHL